MVDNMEFKVKVIDGDVYINKEFVSHICTTMGFWQKKDAIVCAIRYWLYKQIDKNEDPVEFRLNKLKSRKPNGNKRMNNTQLVLDYIEKLPRGIEPTNKAIMEGTGLEKRQLEVVKRSPAIKELLRSRKIESDNTDA